MKHLSNSFTIAQWRAFIKNHQLLKDCLTCAILWPTSSMMQEIMQGKNFETFDYMRTLRFGIYGSLCAAPLFHGWIKLTTAMWPEMNFRIGLTKAAIEQISYGPFACASFFMGISLLENMSVEQAVQVLKDKFVPTWQVGVWVWPILQTINFSMIPENNRLVFVTICNLLWTTFLAYMKYTHKKIPSEHFEDKK